MASKFKYFDTVYTSLKYNMVLYHKIRLKISRIPHFLKNHSVSIVSNTAKNCEGLAAYKLRRSQQMLLFYRRLWGDIGFKNLVLEFRQRIFKQLSERCKGLMLTGFCLSKINWDSLRIPEDQLLQHTDDIDYIRELTAKTLTCSECNQRLVLDVPVKGISYCTCTGTQPAYNKKTEGCPWMPFIERKDLLVWRSENGHGSGLYQYKVYGRYADVRADIFLKVQVDTDYRKKWDPSAVDIKVVDSEPCSNSDIIYWEMLWPSFFANRDYVFNRRFIVKFDKNLIIIKNQITNVDTVPEYPEKVRVKEYWCTMLIKPFTTFDEPGLEFCMTYFDNPGLSIPSAVQTWVGTKAMPNFLTKLRDAAIAFRVEYEKSPDTLSPWPENFSATQEKCEDKPKTSNDDEDDYSPFKLFQDAFCKPS